MSVFCCLLVLSLSLYTCVTSCRYACLWMPGPSRLISVRMVPQNSNSARVGVGGRQATSVQFLLVPHVCHRIAILCQQLCVSDAQSQTTWSKQIKLGIQLKIVKGLFLHQEVYGLILYLCK